MAAMGKRILVVAGWQKHKIFSYRCYTQEDIDEAFVVYYTELFTAGTELDMDDCVDALDRNVTMEMNQKLLAEFTIEEIYFAMNQMHPMKASGTDGF